MILGEAVHVPLPTLLSISILDMYGVRRTFLHGTRMEQMAVAKWAKTEAHTSTSSVIDPFPYLSGGVGGSCRQMGSFCCFYITTSVCILPIYGDKERPTTWTNLFFPTNKKGVQIQLIVYH